MTSFLAEIGVKPVLVATGAKNRNVAEHIKAACGDLLREEPIVRENVDFFDIVEEAQTLAPDILVGHSKGQRAARDWNIPLLRVGFPIHDRFGGQRLLHEHRSRLPRRRLGGKVRGRKQEALHR